MANVRCRRLSGFRRSSVHRWSWLFVAAAMALLLVAQPALACPTCKDSLSQGPNAGNLVQGYFWSIVFMMSMPFVILGGLGSYFYWEVRKARARMSIRVEPTSLAEIT